MEGIIQYIKERQWLKIIIIIACVLIIFLILLGLVVGVPVLIHISFDIPAPVEWLEAEWDREDVLSYYGDVLGFLGTVALSSLALWQNHVIKVEADKREKLLEKMEYDKHMPILHCNNAGCNGRYSNLKIRIRNVSDNVADEVSIENVRIKNEDGTIVHTLVRAAPGKVTIQKESEKYFELKNQSLSGKNVRIEFELKFKDIFQKEHIYKAFLIVDDTEKFYGSEYQLMEQKEST